MEQNIFRCSNVIFVWMCTYIKVFAFKMIWTIEHLKFTYIILIDWDMCLCIYLFYRTNNLKKFYFIIYFTVNKSNYYIRISLFYVRRHLIGFRQLRVRALKLNISLSPSYFIPSPRNFILCLSQIPRVSIQCNWMHNLMKRIVLKPS